MFGIVLSVLLADSLVHVTERVRRALFSAMLAFPLYQFGYLSFSVPWVPSRDIRLGPLLLLTADRESSFARPADSTRWPAEEIVDLIATHDTNPGPTSRIRVVGHIPFLDGPVLSSSHCSVMIGRSVQPARRPEHASDVVGLCARRVRTHTASKRVPGTCTREAAG